AEEHPAPATVQNCARARVISRVKPERPAWHAGFDHRLNDAIRGPGLGAAGFEYQRDLHRDRRNPERMDAGRIARQHDAERLRAREKADRMALVGAEAG